MKMRMLIGAACLAMWTVIWYRMGHEKGFGDGLRISRECFFMAIKEIAEIDKNKVVIK